MQKTIFDKSNPFPKPDTSAHPPHPCVRRRHSDSRATTAGAHHLSAKAHTPPPHSSTCYPEVSALFRFMPARVSEAIVLQTYPLKESDLVVSFLARDLGKLRGVAKRARRPKSVFGSGLERLSQVRMSYFSEPCARAGQSRFLRIDSLAFRSARQLQRRRRAGLSGGNFRATAAAGRVQRTLLPAVTRRARSHALGRPHIPIRGNFHFSGGAPSFAGGPRRSSFKAGRYTLFWRRFALPFATTRGASGKNRCGVTSTRRVITENSGRAPKTCSTYP
jgi:recombination protein O